MILFRNNFRFPPHRKTTHTHTHTKTFSGRIESLFSSSSPHVRPFGPSVRPFSRSYWANPLPHMKREEVGILLGVISFFFLFGQALGHRKRERKKIKSRVSVTSFTRSGTLRKKADFRIHTLAHTPECTHAQVRLSTLKTRMAVVMVVVRGPHLFSYSFFPFIGHFSTIGKASFYIFSSSLPSFLEE